MYNPIKFILGGAPQGKGLRIKNRLKNQRGATAILTSFFILMIILLVALVAATIMIFEIKMSREIANSIPAFFAADAGVEKCLYQARKGSEGCSSVSGSTSVNLANGGTAVAVRNDDSIESAGVFSQTNRKIEVNW